MTTTETPSARLCGRIDGAEVCTEECWRHAALGDAECRTAHGYGGDTDCVCGRNFDTVRALREHLTKARTA